ncbi:unnamed protein product [Calicophoron daubneyi]|uniref:G-protein coupled receptors family 1 profile domain-containing protein n=1 Tax=Calicophoron daubneyi TaxID=300641 RepID=A0AAV2TTX2_CALDB
MDFEKVFSECVKNSTKFLRTKSHDLSDVNISMNEDIRIDSETYTINKVCFSLALISALLHLLLILCFRGIRLLYGPLIILELVWFTLIHFMTLVSSAIDPESSVRLIVGSITDLFILATVCTNLMSSVSLCRQMWLGAAQTPWGYVVPVRDERQCQVGCLQLKWNGRPCYIFSSALIILGVPTAVVIMNSCLRGMTTLTTDHLEFSNVSCNLIPNVGHFFIFFPTVSIVLLAQLMCCSISAKLRYGSQEQSTLLAQLPHVTARFWITVKLATTHCLIWLAAFFALFYASVAMWHVFTLLSSLQSIFVTVNFTFSRPVLDLIHQWQEDKLDQLKTEVNLIRHPLKIQKTLVTIPISSNPALPCSTTPWGD